MADLVSNLREMARQYTDNQYNLYARSADRIVTLEAALRKIADIEHEDLPRPAGAAEGTLWVILAGCVEVARKALEVNDD